jgi:hypothetical protein
MTAVEVRFGKRMRALAAATLVAVHPALTAGSLSMGVIVSVTVAPSSGACEAVATAPGVEVSCLGPRGALLPPPGDVAFQRVGTIPLNGVVQEPLPLYSDGTKITSWRVVTLDNARYVELTIAW